MLTPGQYFSEKVKRSVKLFSGLLITETNVFVSHGRHVSQYYLDVQHFKLREDTHFSYDH